MRQELATEGVDVMFVAINGLSADNDADRQQLIDRCSFPILQDVEEVNVWTYFHRAVKDDIFVYDPEGKLFEFFPILGMRETNLATDEGYDNLKQAILDAAQ